MRQYLEVLFQIDCAMLLKIRRLNPMVRVLVIVFAVVLVAALAGFAVKFWQLRYGEKLPPVVALDVDATEALYSPPISPPEGPLRVYHLGHSLVGRDMPVMLAQLAGAGHEFDSQLGWGTALRAHWEPLVRINGFRRENAHPNHRPAHDAVSSGDYDALIVTEMVEIRDAIRYFHSADYLYLWARAAREANPDVRVYLYETWHPLDDPEGWLERLDRDLDLYWETEILRPALARDGLGAPIYVIPAGQVFARLVREIEARGGVGNVSRREDLFNRNPDGTQDMIHFNDLGAYLVALTHYAVLYHRNPVGLPYQLRRADGSAADAPTEEIARLMQEVVWQVVTHYPKTGVAQAPGG